MAGPGRLPSGPSSHALLAEGQAGTGGVSAHTRVPPGRFLPAASRTYLQPHRRRLCGLCRAAPAQPLPAPSRAEPGQGQALDAAERSGGRRAAGTGKRSRPCAGNRAAGREEGKQHPGLSPSSLGRSAAAPPRKGLSAFPAAFPLPSTWTVGFVCLLLCLEGFNDSVEFCQS